MGVIITHGALMNILAGALANAAFRDRLPHTIFGLLKKRRRQQIGSHER
jgi:hypothetical protein